MKTVRGMTLQMGLALCLAAPVVAGAADPLPSPDTETWAALRANLFQGRPVAVSDTVIALDAPDRAEDGAVVPIAVRTSVPQTPAHYVKTITLLIEQNPNPVAAVFRLSPESGRADVETRVRVDAYSWVRAVAEMNDGKLFVASRFVKASGGCSAPAGNDQAAALARLGQIKLLAGAANKPAQPVPVQLMVSHPNHSGLAMDQLTRLYVPAHYVRKFTVRSGEQAILSADVNFSISENPYFRFYVLPRGNEKLQVEVEDTHNLVFRSSTVIPTSE
jgi:sulfur-oxidizing protein SoxY